MRMQKDIADKATEFEYHQKKAVALFQDIEKWLKENHEDGICYEDFSIEDNPSGVEQGEGEYCDQYCHGEDSYSGNYYIPIEGSSKYFRYGYWC